MLKKNKVKIIISSVIILLPILFGVILWNDLPDIMTTHWGADGTGDGLSTKAFAVFGMPVILLAIHLLCLLATAFDKHQKDQNRKAMGMVFWIIPMISLFVNGITYRAAMGGDFDLVVFMPVLFGVLFIGIGNYMPKVVQNRTLGIKISWTLGNEENWNKTHRFAGKIWVIGGLLLFISLILPRTISLWVMACIIALLILLPFMYSWFIYRRHRKEGIVYDAKPKSKADKIALSVTSVLVPVILIGVAVLMFSGNITVDCGDTAVGIDVPYWTDVEIDYAEIETVVCRDDLDPSVRTNGFASARLSLGIFRNDEFGLYTLYAYNGAKEFVVLTSGEKTLVIGMKTPEETQAVYNTLLEKMDRQG